MPPNGFGFNSRCSGRIQLPSDVDLTFWLVRPFVYEIVKGSLSYCNHESRKYPKPKPKALTTVTRDDAEKLKLKSKGLRAPLCAA